MVENVSQYLSQHVSLTVLTLARRATPVIANRPATGDRPPSSLERSSRLSEERKGGQGGDPIFARRRVRGLRLRRAMGRKGVCVRDPLSDLFTRIRNGQHARRVSILAPHSRMALAVLSVLIERGYVRGARVVPPASYRAPQYNMLEILLKYNPRGKGAINSIARVSKPSRRVYTAIDDLPRSAGGLGTFILSTPKGVIHCAEARRLRVGGEVLGEVL